MEDEVTSMPCSLPSLPWSISEEVLLSLLWQYKILLEVAASSSYKTRGRSCPTEFSFIPLLKRVNGKFLQLHSSSDIYMRESPHLSTFSKTYQVFLLTWFLIPSLAILIVHNRGQKLWGRLSINNPICLTHLKIFGQGEVEERRCRCFYAAYKTYLGAEVRSHPHCNASLTVHGQPKCDRSAPSSPSFARISNFFSASRCNLLMTFSTSLRSFWGMTPNESPGWYFIPLPLRFTAMWMTCQPIQNLSGQSQACSWSKDVQILQGNELSRKTQ